MLRLTVRFRFDGAHRDDPWVINDIWVDPNSILSVLPCGVDLSKVTLITGEKLDVPENAEKLVDKIKEAKRCVRN